MVDKKWCVGVACNPGKVAILCHINAPPPIAQTPLPYYFRHLILLLFLPFSLSTLKFVGIISVLCRRHFFLKIKCLTILASDWLTAEQFLPS